MSAAVDGAASIAVDVWRRRRGRGGRYLGRVEGGVPSLHARSVAAVAAAGTVPPRRHPRLLAGNIGDFGRQRAGDFGITVTTDCAGGDYLTAFLARPECRIAIAAVDFAGLAAV